MLLMIGLFITVSALPSPHEILTVSMMPKLVHELSEILTNSLLQSAVSLITLKLVFGIAPFTLNTVVTESIQPFKLVTCNCTL